MKLNIDSDIFEVGNFSVMDKLIDSMLHTCNAVIKKLTVARLIVSINNVFLYSNCFFIDLNFCIET